MNKLTLFSIFCYLLTGTLFSQTSDGVQLLQSGLTKKKQDKYYSAISDFAAAQKAYQLADNKQGNIQAGLEWSRCQLTIGYTDKAEEQLATLLPLVVATHGKESIEYLDVLLEYTIALKDNSKSTQAIILLKEATTIFKKKKYRANLAIVYTLLAINHIDPLAALEYAKKAEDYFKKYAVKNTYWESQLYNKFHSIYHFLGWMYTAEKYGEKAINTLDQSEAKGLLWANTAQVVLPRFRRPEQKKIVSQIDSINIALFGENTLRRTLEYTSVINLMDSFHTAQQALEASLMLLKDTFGINSMPYVNGLQRLAKNHSVQKNYQEAKKNYQEADTLLQRIRPDDYQIIDIKIALAEISRKYEANCEQAMAILEEVKQKRQQLLGTESILCYIDPIENFITSWCLFQSGKTEQLWEDFRIKETKIKQIASDSSFFLHQLVKDRGFMYSQNKEYEQAIAAYKSTYEFLLSQPNKDIPLLLTISSMIVGDYVSLRSYEKAMHWVSINKDLLEENQHLLKETEFESAYDVYIGKKIFIYYALGDKDSLLTYLKIKETRLDSTDNDYYKELMEVASKYRHLTVMYKTDNYFDKTNNLFRKSKKAFEKAKMEGKIPAFSEASYRMDQVFYHLNNYVYPNPYISCDSLEMYFHLWREIAPTVYDSLQFELYDLDLNKMYIESCLFADADTLIQLTERKVALYEEKYPTALLALSNDYDELMAYYYRNGHPVKAKAYQQKYVAANEVLAKEYQAGSVESCMRFIFIISSYRIIEEYDSALVVWKDIFADIDTTTTAPVGLSYLYNEKGNIYKKLEDYDRASFWYQKAIANYPTVDDTKRMMLDNLAKTYLLQQQFQSALKILLENTSLSDSFKVEDQLFILNHLYVGQAYRGLQQYDTAMVWFKTGLQRIGYQEKDLKNSQLFKAYPSAFYQFTAAIANTYKLKYLQTQEVAVIEQALKYSDITLQLQSFHWTKQKKTLQVERPQRPEEEAKQLAQYYEDAIHIRLLFYELTGEQTFQREAYQLVEAHKASIFKEGLKKNLKRQKQSFCAAQVQAVEKEIMQLQGQLENVAQDKIIDLQNQLTSKQEERSLLSKDCKELEKLYAQKNISIEEVQAKLLHDTTTLLQFSIADSLIISTLIRRDTYLLTYQAIPKNFKESISTYIRELKNPDPSKAVLVDEGHKIYQILFADLEHLLTDKLIIIPDDLLFYLPYEALLPNKPDEVATFANVPWLGKEKTISYSFSTGQLLDLQTPYDIFYAYDFCGFAPTYTGYGVNSKEDFAFRNADYLFPLEHSQEEINSCSSHFPKNKVKNYFGNDANAINFQRFTGGAMSRIIHLAVHAKGNERSGYDSYMTFSTGQDSSYHNVAAREIMQIQGNNMPCEMLVQSACETNVGKLRVGEGLIGFNRAFTWAGAKSIVSSLWSVADESTKDLMSHFYQNLKNGDRKDVAMQKAKRTLMKEGKAPFHWAAFTVYGNTKPVF